MPALVIQKNLIMMMMTSLTLGQFSGWLKTEMYTDVAKHSRHNFTACAVATRCCISDVSCQLEGAILQRVIICRALY